MKIEIFFTYPLMDIYSGESNLFRIIDKDLRETIIVYLVSKNNKHYINIINTITDNINNLLICEDLSQLDDIVNKFKDNQDEIKNKNDLYKIEEYILKLLKS